LELLKEHVKNTEAEREVSDSEKRKILREAEVAKQIYTTEATQKQQLMLQEKRRPCDQCDTLRKKLEDTEKQLKIVKLTTNSSAGSALSDLEHLELQDLQKVVRCSVCQDRKKSVIISKCFHMFCKECVDNNLKSRNRKCPTCKKMFGQDDVKSVWIT
jgi:E3 ubiquitin-protein ligase BRE1